MKYLGVDFGLRRVGLAISEGSLASPYKIIAGRGIKDLAKKIADLVRQENFDQVIVGMPGGKMGQNVRGFIKFLKASGLEVIEADETLSSQDAVKVMIEQGLGRKKRVLNDAHAAAIILQNFLDKR